MPKKGQGAMAGITKLKKTSRGFGKWTAKSRYDSRAREMEIRFKSGFVATYPNTSPEAYEQIKKGAETRTIEPPRKCSSGAALHQSGHLSKYREGMLTRVIEKKSGNRLERYEREAAERGIKRYAKALDRAERRKK